MSRNKKNRERPNRKESAKQKREAKKRAARLRWIGIASIPILFIVGIILAGINRQAGTPDPANLSEVMPANIDGTLEASVIIVEWGDFG